MFPRTLIIATHNPDKMNDLRHYFKDDPVEVLPIDGYTKDDPEEIGETFEENAFIKARHSFVITGLPSVADDSGFCMRCLDGKPGIHAGRFAEKDGVRNFRFAFATLKEMLGDKDPATDFICTVAYKDSDCEKVFRGVLEGYFDFTKSDQPGFGYTPIFVPIHHNPEHLSLAQMGDTLRRQFSSRGKAVAMLRDWLITQ